MQPQPDLPSHHDGFGLSIGSTDAPLISITPLADALPPVGVTLALAPELAAAIAGLLHSLPTLIGAAATSSGAYLVRFAPDISAQLAMGQATLMQAVEGGVRAIAVDAHGTVLAHGTLVPLGALNPALVAAGLWQMAAIATAQHYLVAMQQQLARIETAIGELRDWLENREVAGLVTSARYLHDALATHSGASFSALPEHVANQVEAIAREAAGVVEARRLTLARGAERVRSLPLSDPIWWNVERNIATLRDALASADRDMQVGALGLAVWDMAAAARRVYTDAPADTLADARRRTQARAQLANAHREVSETARRRSDAVDAPSDVRRVLPNLRQLVHAEVDASAHLRDVHLGPEHEAMALRDDQPLADAGQGWHNLVARQTASGSWALTPYHAAATPAAPSHACIAAEVYRRLLRVPMLNLGSLGLASHARPRFRLRNGMTIKTWRNMAGFYHVFVADPADRAVFCGFVPWKSSAITQAVDDIKCFYT